MKGKLTIVTDHPAMAARFVLDCYPQDLPGWIVIVTRPEDVTALPHGALVLPFWTHADDKPPPCAPASAASKAAACRRHGSRKAGPARHAAAPSRPRAW